MSIESDIGRLASWCIEGQLTEERCSEVTMHPSFERAARFFVSNMMTSQADPGLRGVFQDAAHYIAAMMALYLHTSGGITLPRFKQACTQVRSMSPGRARALLYYLRYLNWIVPVPGTRPQRYAPTASFIAAWHGHLRVALQASTIIEPAAMGVLERFDHPEVAERYVHLVAMGDFATSFSTPQTSATMRIFQQRRGATQIVMSLMLATNGGNFPPTGAIPFSAAEVSRRFQVSRPQVRRVLMEAEREGLLSRKADGAVEFHESARRELRFLCAGQIARCLVAAAFTVRQLPHAFAQETGAAIVIKTDGRGVAV